MFSNLVETALLMQYLIYYGAPCGKTEIATHTALWITWHVSVQNVWDWKAIILERACV